MVDSMLQLLASYQSHGGFFQENRFRDQSRQQCRRYPDPQFLKIKDAKKIGDWSMQVTNLAQNRNITNQNLQLEKKGHCKLELSIREKGRRSVEEERYILWNRAHKVKLEMSTF